MPFALPSLDDLRQRALASLGARIPGAAPASRRSPLATLAQIPVSLVWDCLRYLNWQVLQLFPETAESIYLDRYGARYNLPRKQASASAGVISVTFLLAGSIAANTPLQTSDGSVVGTIQAALTNQPAGTVNVAFLTTTAGSAANLAPGTVLLFVAAIAGVAPTATVALAADGVSGLTGGVDVETDAAYAARIRQREQRVPQGGATGDYQGWAEAVSGVTRAWEYPRNRGTGTIDVSFVMDGRANIIPLPADVVAVQAALDANRPVVGDSVAFAPIADPVAVVLSKLLWTTGTTSAAGEAAIAVSLQAIFLQATPGGAGSGPGIDSAHPAGTLLLEAISDAITQTVGVAGFDLVFPASDIVSARGHIATFAGATFQ